MNTGKLLKRDNLIALIVTYLSSIAIYSLIITQRITNTYDGLWKSSYFTAGAWEISCGRFVWPYLDHMRARMCNDPYMSLVSLLVITIAIVLADSIVGFKKWYHAIVFNLMFIANVAICVFLSYRFMSPTFAFSIFFAIVAVYLIQNTKKWFGIILSSICIMLTMGLYQANIGIACVMFLIYIALLIYRGLDYRSIGKELLRITIGFMLGATLYIVFNEIHLKILDIEMSSYLGGNTYSIKNSLAKLPNSLVGTYSQFFKYFFKSPFLVTVYKHFKVSSVVLLTMLILFLIVMVNYARKDYLRAVLVIVTVLLLPLASNVILLVATEADTSIQMTAPSALVIPSLFAIVLTTLEGNILNISETAKKVMCIAVIVVGCFFAYTETLQVCFDQSAMYEGTKSTRWMYNESIDDIKDAGLLDANNRYCYIGKPSLNPLFLENGLFKITNSYSHVGEFWLGGDCATQSWVGVITNIGGASISIIDWNDYEKYRTKQEVIDMPIFPKEGYIKEIDGVVVVKISEDE